MLRPFAFGTLLALALTGCAATQSGGPDAPVPLAQPEAPAEPETSVPPVVEPPAVYAANLDVIPARPTKILDQTAAARLLGNTGLTLQWLGWEDRGELKVYVDRGEYWIEGQQGDHVTDDRFLYVNGRVTEIGPDYFIMKGEITIVGTPDAGRFCKGNKSWRFGVTQGRKYWRLREFEWCDGLTDYVDIYF